MVVRRVFFFSHGIHIPALVPFVLYFTIILQIIIVASLLFNGRHTKYHQKYGQKHQIGPPDNWIPKQIDTISAAREKLTLFHGNIVRKKGKRKERRKKIIKFYQTKIKIKVKHCICTKRERKHFKKRKNKALALF